MHSRRGGEIVAEAEHGGRSGGSSSPRKPEQVAEEPRSYTATLKPLLQDSPAEAAETLWKRKRRALKYGSARRQYGSARRRNDDLANSEHELEYRDLHTEFKLPRLMGCASQGVLD